MTEPLDSVFEPAEWRAPVVADPLRLYRLHIRATPVDTLRLVPVAGARTGFLEGVAAIDLEADEFGYPAHTLRWREERDGSRFRVGFTDVADARVEDVIRRFDRGPVGVMCGDPVSLLAAEVRRLRR